MKRSGRERERERKKRDEDENAQNFFDTVIHPKIQICDFIKVANLQPQAEIQPISSFSIFESQIPPCFRGL